MSFSNIQCCACKIFKRLERAIEKVFKKPSKNPQTTTGILYAQTPMQTRLFFPTDGGQVGIPWITYDVVQPCAQAGLALRKPRRATPLGWGPEDLTSCPEKVPSQKNQGREKGKER